MSDESLRFTPIACRDCGLARLPLGGDHLTEGWVGVYREGAGAWLCGGCWLKSIDDAKGKQG